MRRLRSMAGVILLLVVALARPAAGQGSPPPSNDPGAALQWHLAAIGAPRAWNVSTGSGATIAVVDSGVDLQHEDLQGNRIVGAVTCIGTGGDSSQCVDGGQDDDGHGTHVAGIAAATRDNGIGVAGVAPAANLLAVKVLSETCVITCEASGTAADVSAGIRWAADHGATVINLSLGSTQQPVFGPDFSAAIEYAWHAGAIPVVASGNDYVLSSGFSNEPALVVEAVDRSGVKSSYSNGVGQARWGISAPGGEADDATSCKAAPNGILSTYWRSGSSAEYACLAGTSMAAPQVAAAAAILRSAGLSPTDAVQRLLSSAHDLGAPGDDATYGAGLLDLAAATADLAPTTSDTVAPVSTTVPTVRTDEPPAAVVATNPESPPPTTAAPASSSTTVPLIDLPPATVAPNQAAARISPRGGGGGGVPLGPVAVAAAVAALTGAATGWHLLRGTRWARRSRL